MKKTLITSVSTILGLLILMSGCAYTINQKEHNIWEGFHGIFTLVEPADIELYEQLLPENLTMPDHPLVGVFFVDYYDTEPWLCPLPLTPYLESSILLRCVYNGMEGWYSLTMPVSTKAACIAGRNIGYPKYVADEMVLVQTDETWKGSVLYQNQVTIQLEFEPAEIDLASLPEWQSDFMTGVSVSDLTETSITLIPPSEGPEVRVSDLTPLFVSGNQDL